MILNDKLEPKYLKHYKSYYLEMSFLLTPALSSLNKVAEKLVKS